MKPFIVLVFAIIVLVLLFVFYPLILGFFSPLDNSKVIMSGLAKAQTGAFLGELVYLGALVYEKGHGIEKDFFENNGLIFSVECTSPSLCCQKGVLIEEGCDKVVSWDNTFFSVKERKAIQTFLRCIEKERVFLCKLFVGDKPAQAKIDSVEFVGLNELGESEIRLILTNSGEQVLANGRLSLELYKKNNESWERTYYDSNRKEFELIKPGSFETVIWPINPSNIGQYKAVFLFEAENSGFSRREVFFEKTSLGNCVSGEKIELIYDPVEGVYQQFYSCSGCNYAYECVSKLNGVFGKTFYPYSKDKSYCKKSSEFGECID